MHRFLLVFLMLPLSAFAAGDIPTVGGIPVEFILFACTLLGVALFASYVASLNTGKILFLVGAAFSLAASSFFPVLVLGVFWKRTTTRGAIAGMVTGLTVCVYYIVSTYPLFTQLTGFAGPTWFGIEPISSGVFGVPAGFAVAIAVSLVDREPDEYTRSLVDYIRHP